MDPIAHRRLSRRAFLATAAAGGASLMTGGLGSLVRGAPPLPNWPDEWPDWLPGWPDVTIPQLQRLMASGRISSRELTAIYLRVVKKLNPLLHAVIETNPDALEIAAARDAERRQGRLRGPLHGIPIMVKDNIATRDEMETTAGSLALVGSTVPRDAVVVQKLRAAGAVILGKTNLSEWANFRGFAPFNGWSARGGFTRNPYVLDYDPCGSSSGSAVAPAVHMCAAAIGTETDGSIVCPAGNNQIVGLKPTVGLVSQKGIIPIAHSQDTAGPMTRTVTDTAILLNVIRSPFGPVTGRALPDDYTDFLRAGALSRARIGIERRQFQEEYFADPTINAVVEEAIVAIRQAGATIVDPVDIGDTFAWFDAEFTVLLYEFKHDIEAYLATLGNTSMRTLSDLIQFNIEHCPQEMEYFGQEIFEMAEATSGDLTDPVYLDARALSLRLARDEGIDRVLREHNLDAILSPSYAFGSSAPAVAGYPIMAVPVGLTDDGRPAGVELTGGFLQEPRLIAIGYALEQLLDARSRPRFLGAAPPEPPDAGICAALPAAASGLRVQQAPERVAYHPGSGRIIPSR